MKILLTIHEQFNPHSGSAGSTWRIGQQYQSLGHEVWYYSIDDLPQKLPTHLKRLLFPEFVAAKISALSRKQGLDVVDGSPGDIWFWAKMLRKWKKKSPLLVTRSHGLHHLHHIWLLEEARRGNLRLSWIYPLYRGGLKLWEVANSLRYADLVFLLNHQESEYVVTHLNVNPEGSHVFPNGIPKEFINLPFEPLPKGEDSVIRIAQVSTYIPRKGIQYSVPALNKILTRYPRVKMSFFGAGCPEEKVYNDFEPAVRDRIQVVPYFNHEQLPTLLKGHQIKLFPPLSEGFGKALVEGMACGLAPITTAIEGPMEIVSDGHDGIVIPTRDSAAIEQALERLITDRPYLEQLRHNAYATAQNYSWRRIAQNRLSVYEEALCRKKELVLEAS
ncbi:MAG: glycosyltransferase family 4 protein [Symploca sp. SIO3E6]|nr:glycosyltransferase family 4 protein [Caldora sp. SIO3E6]